MAHSDIKTYFSQWLKTATDGKVVVEYAFATSRMMLMCTYCSGDFALTTNIPDDVNTIDYQIQQFVSIHSHKGAHQGSHVYNHICGCQACKTQYDNFVNNLPAKIYNVYNGPTTGVDPVTGEPNVWKANPNLNPNYNQQYTSQLQYNPVGISDAGNGMSPNELYWAQQNQLAVTQLKKQAAQEALEQAALAAEEEKQKRKAVLKTREGRKFR